jgi:hypothetical protein
MHCDTAPAVERKIAFSAVDKASRALRGIRVNVRRPSLPEAQTCSPRKGRASFPGERSRGHIDPGARQLMIAARRAHALPARRKGDEEKP